LRFDGGVCIKGEEKLELDSFGAKYSSSSNPSVSFQATFRVDRRIFQGLNTVGDVLWRVAGSRGRSETIVQILKLKAAPEIEFVEEPECATRTKQKKMKLRGWRGVVRKLTSNLRPFTKEHG